MSYSLPNRAGHGLPDYLIPKGMLNDREPTQRGPYAPDPYKPLQHHTQESLAPVYSRGFEGSNQPHQSSQLHNHISATFHPANQHPVSQHPVSQQPARQNLTSRLQDHHLTHPTGPSASGPSILGESDFNSPYCDDTNARSLLLLMYSNRAPNAPLHQAISNADSFSEDYRGYPLQPFPPKPRAASNQNEGDYHARLQMQNSYPLGQNEQVYPNQMHATPQPGTKFGMTSNPTASPQALYQHAGPHQQASQKPSAYQMYQTPNQPAGFRANSQYSGIQNQNRRKNPGSGACSDLPEGRRVVTSPSFPSNVTNSSTPKREFQSRTKSLSSNSLKQNLVGVPSGHRSSPSNSGHTFSLSSKSRSFSSLGKLSSLSTKKFSSSTSLKNDRIVSTSTLSSQKTATGRQPRKPAIYPAILSRVAKGFKESLVLGINMKDGLEYHDSFTGKEAVDAICYLIRTNDRNLALLLGRAMDAQKFYHDVTYNHRLRDSQNEVYAFSRVYSDMEFFPDDSNTLATGNNSQRGSLVENQANSISLPLISSNAPYPTSPLHGAPGSPHETAASSFTNLNKLNEKAAQELTGVNGVFTILTDCYSPTCNRNSLCYSIACPRRLEQQARLNMKPRGGLKRAVSRLSLHDTDTVKTLWHETVDNSVLDKLDKHEKMRQELIYELIYTERDYVKDLEFMTDFYIMPLRNPANNIIPERERDAFIRTVFGGVSDLLRLAKSLSESLTSRQQKEKPVIESIGDVVLQYVGSFEPFIKYSGNKVFASFEHERQQQVNMKYSRFLEAIEKKPESRKQDLSSFLIKGVQRPARYQLLVAGILKNTNESSPDYKNLLKAKEEIEKVLGEINVQTGESTDRHKIMVLHRLLGRQTLEERYNFKLHYSNRIIYQVTLNRKRDNEKIDIYLFEHALLMVKHKIQNKREVHKVFERPIYLPLFFINSGYDSPTFKTLLQYREDGSIVSDTGLKKKMDTSQYNPVSSSQQKLQVNFFGLGNNPVHVSLFADDVTTQNQLLLQVQQQQMKLIAKHDIFSLCKYETRRFSGNNRINCGVPCYGGKKLLYGTDGGVWVSTVRTISATSNQRICSDPTMVISKPYVTQMEVLVEYSKILVLSDKTLYEFDLSCTDSLDHVKNTRSGKVILNHVSFFKTGVCEGKLLVCAVKSGNTRAIAIVEPTNPFDKNKNKHKRMDVREISFSSEPVSISFLKTKLCVGCTKGFEILSLGGGEKEPILDEADPSLDFATQRESVTPLAIHRLDKNFLLSYSEFSFLINKNGWRTKHDWGIFWEGSPQNIALFYPYLLAFEPGFIEIRDLESCMLIRALVGENIRFLHSNEHEALYACEENGYDIIVSIDFLNLKPKPQTSLKLPIS